MRIVAGVLAEDRSSSRGTRTVGSRCGFEAKDTSRRGDALPRCPVFLAGCVWGCDLSELARERHRADSLKEKATAAARSHLFPFLDNFHLFFLALLRREI